MDELLTRISKQLCCQHEIPIESICLLSACKHQQQWMCEQCIQQCIEIDGVKCGTNIKYIVDFLNEQTKLNTPSELYIKQAQMIQQFQGVRQQIIEMLDQLEQLLVNQISQLNGTFMDEVQQQGYLQGELNNDKFIKFGLLLKQKIREVKPGEYQLYEVQTIDQQASFKKMNMLLEQSQSALTQITQQHRQSIKLSQKKQRITQLFIKLNYQTQFREVICKFQQQLYLNCNCINTQVRIFEVTLDGKWYDGNSGFNQQDSLDIDLIQFSPNSTLIATRSKDDFIRIWQKSDTLKQWELQKKLPLHNDSVRLIQFNHCSTLIALLNGNYISIREYYDGRWVLRQVIQPSATQTNDFKFNSHYAMLAIASDDKYITLWKWGKLDISMFSNKDIVCKYHQRLIAHLNTVLCVEFSKDSQQLISGGQDKQIRIWMPDDQGQWIQKYYVDGTSPIQTVLLNQFGDFMVAGTIQGLQLNCYDSINNKWKCIQTINQENVKQIAINEYSTKIITGSIDNTIRVYTI